MRIYIFGILFIIVIPLLWSTSDRLREIASFDKWKSIFKNSWWDRDHTPGKSKINPFRDGYHWWKNFAIFVYEGIIGYFIYYISDNILYGLGTIAVTHIMWSIGQWAGLKLKKDKY